MGANGDVCVEKPDQSQAVFVRTTRSLMVLADRPFPLAAGAEGHPGRACYHCGQGAEMDH